MRLKSCPFKAIADRLRLGTLLRQSARETLRDVEKLRRGLVWRGQGVAKHGVAKWTCGADCVCSGGNKLLGTHMTHAFAGFFSEKCEPSSGPAAEASFSIARGLDQLPRQLD